MKQKNKSGITLIALIITIIILLILAGISISMITGENGLLTQTQNAKIKHLIAQDKERLELILLDIQADNKGQKPFEEVYIAFVKDKDNKRTVKKITYPTNLQNLDFNNSKALHITGFTLNGFEFTYNLDGDGKITILKDRNPEDNIENPTENTEVLIEKITLDKTAIEDFVKSNNDRKNKLIDKITATISNQNATNKNILWTSSDNNVATVDNNGNVTAVGAGNCIITATAEDEGKASASCDIIVKEKKYIYYYGTEYTDITGGFESTITTIYNGHVTGISDFKKYDNFMKLYTTASGDDFAGGSQIITKNSINKEEYKYLVIEMKARSKDNYNRQIIALKGESGNKLYDFLLNPKQVIDRSYLKIPLEQITEKFYIQLSSSAVYNGEVDFSIYNIFLANEVDEEIQISKLPQGQEKVYILKGNDECEDYTGGWIKGANRYKHNDNPVDNGQYTGTSYIEVKEDCVITYGVSNGSDYGTSSRYTTSEYFEKGEYTKLNIDFEATSNDNYKRNVINLIDENGGTIYCYQQAAKETINRKTLQIDLTGINKKFYVQFGASAVQGGTTQTKVYNIYFSK